MPLKVLAWAPREKVFENTTGQGIVSEGTRWWRSTEPGKTSWGFTSGPATISLEGVGCDGSGTSDKTRAVCWWIGTGGGYQCGDSFDQSGENGWKLDNYERIILEME